MSSRREDDLLDEIITLQAKVTLLELELGMVRGELAKAVPPPVITAPKLRGLLGGPA